MNTKKLIPANNITKNLSSFNYSMIEDIKTNILINNIADKDQTLTPAKKIARKRGKVVWIDKENHIPIISRPSKTL